MKKGKVLFLILLEILRKQVFSISTTGQSNVHLVDSPDLRHVLNSGRQLEKRSVACQPPTAQTTLYCTEKARATGSGISSLDEELGFFKKCIADYFCFQKAPGRTDAWATMPDFRGILGTSYFNNAAKKVERFFVRNNNWDRLKDNPKIRNPATGECTNLLHVIAARHMYSIFVLNLLSGSRTFGPCDKAPGSGKLVVPPNGECYPAHYGPVTCTTDHDIALLGKRSGTLAALYERFFKETAGPDPQIPGFGISPEDIMNSNVYAASLHCAIPNNYAGLTNGFLVQMAILNRERQFQIQEAVCAISKMWKYNSGYYNDLHSDHVELRHQPTKHDLFNMYQQWAMRYQSLVRSVKAYFGSVMIRTEVSYRHRVNMVYEMMLGKFEYQNLPSHIAKALTETAMPLIYGSETYNTRGAIRHVVGWTQMRSPEIANQITITDYWVSMLENWADTIKGNWNIDLCCWAVNSNTAVES